MVLNNTMMVLGIGCVIWGLARGAGRIAKEAENRTVDSAEYCRKNMGVKDLVQASVGG